MRRTRIVVAVSAAMIVSLGLASTATAAQGPDLPSGSSSFGASSAVWEQRLVGWLFGSATNPLLQDNFCGEQVGNVFFLNVATVPSYEATCEIPTGTQIVASPGGTVVWEPTEAQTDEGLLDELSGAVADLSNPTAAVDGHPLDVANAFVGPLVYTIPVAEGSFIKTVDPTFPAELTETRIASAAWILRIHPLPPGEHEIILGDEIGGEAFTATFHITVTPGHRSG
jgi:hypothetical protein